jgi:hypothetical protein
MHFVTASHFSMDAQIDPRHAAGNAKPHDVYLYVQALNMPTKVTGPTAVPPPGPPSEKDNATIQEYLKGPGEQRPATNLRELPVDQRRALLQYLVARQQPSVRVGDQTYKIEDLGMPTYRVFAYQDTGATTTKHGRSVAVLEPMQGFGYYVSHEGGLSGWKHGLLGAGAIDLGNNVYKIPGVYKPVSVTTFVDALTEPAEHQIWKTWWFWLFIVLGMLLFLIFIVKMKR